MIAALKQAFETSSSALAIIEQCFELITAEMPQEIAPYFFQSWSMTNHSAMAVSAIGNKMTGQLLSGKVTDHAALLQALGALHRISDEDLGATGGTLHQDLFYDMALAFCGSDHWQSQRYVVKAGKQFKEYRLRNVVRTRDQLHALLATAVHEVYTHAEVEFILPLFKAAAAKQGLTELQASRALAWIKVHCGGVEQKHFGHALDAITFWCEATGADLASFNLDEIFRDYLDHKAQVMGELSAMLLPLSEAV